ncbi:MAG: hypothetical protein LYZ69_03000 [Nitrososphaerales archaeon]|nr:hypothetical protein [Nitrososphaerales archaeon]
MVEILEYALVVFASTLVISFSFVNYSAYSASIENATQRADYSSYLTLAYAAIERGSSSGALSLDHASLNCSSGRLEFDSPSFSAGSSLPVGCGFTYTRLIGPHILTFRYSNGYLGLEVG